MNTETISAFRVRLYWPFTAFSCLCFTMGFPAKITSSCIWVVIPFWLSHFTLVYLWCGRTVVPSGGRCTATWLPNFLGWVDLPTRVLRWHALRARESSASNNRVFSHDVTAAILMSQNNEMAALLVSQTNPVGVELFSYANAFFCSNKFA